MQQQFPDMFSPCQGAQPLYSTTLRLARAWQCIHNPTSTSEDGSGGIWGHAGDEGNRRPIESNCARCRPIVLVTKKYGSIRFCVDNRRVNDTSRFDAYPMPWGDKHLNWLGNARFFPGFDQGLHADSLVARVPGKKSFSTFYRLYQFITLPFGLFGAPATF